MKILLLMFITNAIYRKTDCAALSYFTPLLKTKAAQSAALHGARTLAHERACELLGVRRSAPSSISVRS